jgi:hypothetical protein
MAINEEIFLGSGATLAFVPEVDLYFRILHSQTGAGYDTGTVKTKLMAHSYFSGRYRMVDNIYVGCMLDVYDQSTSITSPASSHLITANNNNELTITPAHAVTLADNDFAIIRGYGAPCVGALSGTTARLNADNWLGLVETASFPNIETEMKQINLQLGGTRNFSHQYKGIRTASGGNINVVANHGVWLYYALGQCTQISAEMAATTLSTNVTAHGTNSNDDLRYVYLDTETNVGDVTNSDKHISTGPIFYKTNRNGDILIPPVMENLDVLNGVELLDRTTTTATAITNPITYTFDELNTEELPSFALEQSLSKLETTNTFKTGDTGLGTESHTFTRIARGNRVNTFTMTANENEEVKMTMDLNTRAVHKLSTSESYEARGGITNNAQLFNYEQASEEAEFLEPFFFSSGSINVFGQQFLKITNFTLTINNNLQDKRFIGVGSKDIKSAIPAQRNYEISFTAIVTDNKIFEEVFTETEATSTTVVTDGSSNGVIQLLFDKDNGEQIKLQFKNYHISTNTWTVPDDRGPITVEATIMPRSLHSCTVKTHWVLQG